VITVVINRAVITRSAVVIVLGLSMGDLLILEWHSIPQDSEDRARDLKIDIGG
jgi:hypothetical protein